MSCANKIFSQISPLRRRGNIPADCPITDNNCETTIKRARILDGVQFAAELNAYRANKAAVEKSELHDHQYQRSLGHFVGRARDLNDRWACRERTYRHRRQQQLTQRLDKCHRRVMEHEQQTREFADMKNRLLYQYPQEARREMEQVMQQTRAMRRMEFNFFRDLGVQIC